MGSLRTRTWRNKGGGKRRKKIGSQPKKSSSARPPKEPEAEDGIARDKNGYPVGTPYYVTR